MESFIVICEGSSPPARGLQSQCFELGLGVRLIPACAGTTEHGDCFIFDAQAHPRLRGDYPLCTFSIWS